MNALLERFLGANTRLRQLALAFVLSALVYNFPWLLNWLPEGVREDVLKAAHYVLTYGMGLALFWAKDSTVTGNGSVHTPYEKKTGDGGNRLLPLVLLLALPLTGCAQIPVARTYGLSYSDGKQTAALSVRFEPPVKKGRAK